MISDVLQTLDDGFRAVRSNSRMVFVVVLVFVFPLLFVWVTQNFFATAHDNINTAQKQRVGMLHQTLAVGLEQNISGEAMQAMITAADSANADITKIRILKEGADGFLIIHDTQPALIGTYESSDAIFRTIGFSDVHSFLQLEFIIGGERVWQAFRRVQLDDGYHYIFSEHNFALVDSVMSARRQQSYFGLTAIFLFLIGLAYWLRRQSDWQQHHNLLREQLVERDMFSNMIAHEFRSPLTAIKGYASFLQESKTLSPDELRFATNIRGASERLVELVNDFLEVARLQSGKLTINPRMVDLREILTSVTTDLQVMATEKGLSLSYEPDAKSLPMSTDPARMTQVLTNIISNAIKYTNQGAVSIEAVSAYGEITIRVKDTGTGISAEDQQKLFAPFTRVGGVDSGSTTGTGLGMWITKQLVALLDGTIGVESIKGVGTHVVITFRTK
jgi:signal transduction histidine kinase